MRAAFRHTAILEHDDLIAIVDGAQPVRDEDAGSRFIFEDAVDVLQEGLFGVGVEGRCLRSREKKEER